MRGPPNLLATVPVTSLSLIGHIVLRFFVLPYDCGVPLTMVSCIDINGTYIKNSIADVFNK
ncbi:hypothetical protein H5410_006529 [Solanum commersonii]|uniref:Uncharacterized protein n=1 Tax=Solanum commersonii TaxID=4109 RepID=A0A9J6ABL6_SOLCO|nr:hypothetical protein H5410_006529 [Solanum commersonii]